MEAKKYVKNGRIIPQGTPISLGGVVYYNPTEEHYNQAGWKEYEEPEFDESTVVDMTGEDSV